MVDFATLLAEKRQSDDVNLADFTAFVSIHLIFVVMLSLFYPKTGLKVKGL